MTEEFAASTQLKLLPSQLEYLKGYIESLRVLAGRPDLGQPVIEQHIKESLESILQMQGFDSAAFRLAVAATSGGATRSPQTSVTTIEAITTSTLIREDGRQIVAGLLGTATTLRGTQMHEDEMTQQLVGAASEALGIIRTSDNYGNPSMRAAELTVLSFFAGATLRNEGFEAMQQLMDFANELIPEAQV
jgi:hypothetical protein